MSKFGGSLSSQASRRKDRELSFTQSLINKACGWSFVLTVVAILLISLSACSIFQRDTSQPPKTKLTQELQDPNAATRAGAARELAKTRDPQSADLLLALLSDTSIQVRCSAIWAFGEIGTPQVVDQLIAEMYIKNADNGLRDEAIIALTKIAAKHRMPKIIQALQDYDPYVRAGAAEVLGLARDTTALSALKQTMLDTARIVSSAASNALLKMNDTMSSLPFRRSEIARIQENLLSWKKGPYISQLVAAIEWQPQCMSSNQFGHLVLKVKIQFERWQSFFGNASSLISGFVL